MQINIHARGLDLADQGRAYAEYRIFSAVSRFDGDGVQVSVRLEKAGSPVGARYRCIASVKLRPVGRVRVTALADRLHAAVDRAAERLSASVERRLASANGGLSSGLESSRLAPRGSEHTTGKESGS